MKKFLLCLAMTIAAAGCRDGIDNPTDPSQVNIEFSFSDLTVGTGAIQAAAGNTATITYTLWLYNPNGAESKGNRVTGSSDAGVGPYTFTIGTGAAIPGIDQGIRGMRVGGARRVYIPASMAYGSSGTQDGRIPPNAAIVFEIGLTTLQ